MNNTITPCPTCALTIHGDGSVTHEPDCLQQKHNEVLGALHKIGHILKDVGITVSETGVEAATGGLGAFQDQ